MTDVFIPPGVCIGGSADEVTLHCITRAARASRGATIRGFDPLA